MKTTLCLLLAASLLLGSCREREIEVYDVSRVSLNIAKGVFRPNTYPESYEFNAYFLGVGSADYELEIPVRLTGLIDYENDREYRVRVNEEYSQAATQGVEYSLDERQIFHKGLYEDTFRVTIHIARLNETDNYKLRVELVPNENFAVGMAEYQYVDISFVKNVNTPPAFWENTSKLSKYTYYPAKCVKFLEVSGITDPEWEDAGTSLLLDYWIELCIDWFEQNEVIDPQTGNRIYFDE
ncbi:DUF4843 domain-containing protein [Alistipes sp.]|uniref:DUF4843 domain-containing protein n=1 Tax=Alistipes sp. TaxID=1872444 RepID=UPI003A837F8C